MLEAAQYPRSSTLVHAHVWLFPEWYLACLNHLDPFRSELCYLFRGGPDARRCACPSPEEIVRGMVLLWKVVLGLKVDC